MLQTPPGKAGMMQMCVLSGTSKIGLGCRCEQLLVSDTFLALQFLLLKLSTSVYTSEVYEYFNYTNCDYYIQ